VSLRLMYSTHMRHAVRHLPFIQLDVFTSRRLEGNPLAVFTDARSLSTSEMQAVAREMNLSETTFILPDPD
jgi:trans-2,3-dihydro-3-hydroxyanthranilate isomerase